MIDITYLYQKLDLTQVISNQTLLLSDGTKDKQDKVISFVSLSTPVWIPVIAIKSKKKTVSLFMMLYVSRERHHHAGCTSEVATTNIRDSGLGNGCDEF